MLRRRSIETRDLESIAVLLEKGFPRRTRAAWFRGLVTLRDRETPNGMPRYGLMLEADERTVGVLLMISADVKTSERVVRRCNLSSWYVEPPYTPYAPMLLNAALKEKDVTYFNITPAPHTQATVEAQRFQRFGRGSMLYIPVIARRRSRVRAVPLTIEASASLPEADLIADHLAFGCPCFVVDVDGQPRPFVFAPPRLVRGLLPTTHLLYCRDLVDFGRFAGTLGSALVRRGAVAVLVDTDQAIPGLVGRRVNLRQNKYVFGPHPPRPGDLAYTELAIFRD